MKRITIVLTLLGIIFASAWGISNRFSYTNITESPDFMMHFQVAEMSENLLASVSEQMKTDLPSSPIVLRVTPIGTIDCLFKTNRQLVKVEEIYKGEDISVGDQIYLTRGSWRLFFDDMTANMGFVNVMEEEKDYLVFIEGKIRALDSSERVYALADSILFPVFCYDTKKSKVIPINTSPTYVPYSDVKENEFFVCSQEALDSILEIKNYFIDLYP